VATNDQFIKTKPKLMHGFMRALLKALRLVKQNRGAAMDTMMKFFRVRQGIGRAHLRRHDRNFYHQRRGREKRRKNDLDIVREVLNVTRKFPSSAPTISALQRKRTAT